MGKKLRYKKATLEESPNWRKGTLSKHAPKDAKKQICVVRFYDDFGNEYVWSPLKGEVNEVLSIARQMVLAEEMNFPYLENPEPREDIDNLRLQISVTKEAEKGEG